MDYQQFLFTITAGLQSACQAEEKITVQTIEQKHTAKIKTVSLYHRGKRTTPWIYMAPFYRLYQHGYSMESIQKELKNVLDMVTENNKVEGEIFTNFECAAAFLSVRLISYQKNKEFLSLVPHRRILDLAIIYQLVFEGTDTTMGAAVVYQDHCRIWEVTEDILFQTAIASMIRRFPPSLNSVEALIGLPELPVQSDFGGAYYILPSSMHEVLLLAKDKDTDPSQLKEIVEEVNLTDAVSTDFLSNHVYEYDSDEDTVTIVV